MANGRTMSAEDLLAMGYTREDVEAMMEREAERAQEAARQAAPAPAPRDTAPAPAPPAQSPPPGFSAADGPPPGYTTQPASQGRPAPAAPAPRRPDTASAERIQSSMMEAQRQAVELGFTRDEIHQMPDGTFMPGRTHEDYLSALRDAEIREQQAQVVDARDARSTREIAIETLARDGSGRGRPVVVTGRSATLIAREVSSATSVEILITGVESGAQKRVTVNITPGPSALNTPIAGQASPLSQRARSRQRTPRVSMNSSAIQRRADRAVAATRSQETARETVQRIVQDSVSGRSGGARGAVSAESLAQAMSGRR